MNAVDGVARALNEWENPRGAPWEGLEVSERERLREGARAVLAAQATTPEGDGVGALASWIKSDALTLDQGSEAVQRILANAEQIIEQTIWVPGQLPNTSPE